jgi:hypothetical protein
MRRNRTYPGSRNTGPSGDAPLPPLEPYRRCRCGVCRACKDNEKWDRIFAKFEVAPDEWETKGFFRSTLRRY